MNPIEHTNETRRQTRRLLYAARGAHMMICAAWFWVHAGLLVYMQHDPAFKPFMFLTSSFASIVMLLCHHWLRRSRAEAECNGTEIRKNTIRSEMQLFAIISVGVLVAVLLGLYAAWIFEISWLSPAALVLFMILGAAYFLREALVLRLYELALISALLLGYCWPVLTTAVQTQSDAHFEAQFAQLLSLGGVLIGSAGLSLHLRWSNWRAQVLNA